MPVPIEMGTVGLLVAVIFGLIELIKILLKPLAAKLSKNGEAAKDRAVLDTLSKNTKALEAQTKALSEQSARLHSIGSSVEDIRAESSEMYEWHNHESEPGVKVWWVRLGPMQRAIEALQDCGEKRDDMLEKILHILERVSEDTKTTKEDLVKLVLHLRFKDYKGNPLDTSK